MSTHTTFPPGGLGKVLVVDDERDLADLAETLLAAHGLAARTAYSADEALGILAGDDAIGAVFTDIMMPGMTGLQLADTVRELYPHITVVMTSGFTSPALLAGRCPPRLFVTKPYRIETVIALLRG